jgi:hypothetical protein
MLRDDLSMPVFLPKPVFLSMPVLRVPRLDPTSQILKLKTNSKSLSLDRVSRAL